MIDPSDPPTRSVEPSPAPTQPSGQTESLPHHEPSVGSPRPPSQPASRQGRRWPETIMAAATVGLLIATAVNVVVATKQWNALEQSNVTAQQAAGAAQVSARAAQVSADAVVSQLRAYVLVSDADTGPVGTAAPAMAVTIKNTGQTPAYELSWRAKFVLARPTPRDEDFALDRDKRAPTVTLAPGSTLSYKYAFADWKPQFGPLVEKGGLAIFAIGEVLYRDAFGERRFTRYRLISGGGTDVTPGKFGPAIGGNEAN